jgi:hypothetical protein
MNSVSALKNKAELKQFFKKISNQFFISNFFFSLLTIAYGATIKISEILYFFAHVTPQGGLIFLIFKANNSDHKIEMTIHKTKNNLEQNS